MSSNSIDSQFLVDRVEYSPKAFYDSFRNHLPRLVQVTQGYYGEEQVETYERGQKLFIRRFGSQERVVATVQSGPRSLTHKTTCISIPLDYNASFCVLSGKKGGTCKKYKLHSILSKNKLPIDVLFIPDVTSDLTGSTRLMNTNEELILRLTRRYQDSFLLGHYLAGDKVTSIIQKLPLYLTEMRISLVVGRMGYEQQQWNSYIHNLSEICNSQINCDSYFGNPDIALYDKDSEDFDATVQVPNVYCTIYDCLSETNVYQTLHGSKRDSSKAEEKCDTYDVISNCVRETEVKGVKVLPLVPPKPKKLLTISNEQTAKETVANSSKEDKVTPLVPARSDTSSVTVKRHTCTTVKSTAPVSDVNEEEDETTPKSEETTPKLPPRGGDRRGKKVPSNLCVDDVRPSVKEMNMEEVGDLLKKLGLEKHVPVFKEQWIDGAILSELNKDILHKECGMSNIEAVRLMSYVEKGHIPK